MTAIVDVAVAVILNDAGEVLLAQRPPGKVYEGYWEFPGGKVEAGESVRQALDREIDEELGVVVKQAWPWITQVFTYPHATVRLHFHRVTGWQGEPSAVEHSGLVWQRPDAISVAPLLPANGPGTIATEGSCRASAPSCISAERVLQRTNIRKYRAFVVMANVRRSSRPERKGDE